MTEEQFKKAMKALEDKFQEKFDQQQNELVKLEKEVASLKRDLNYRADQIHQIKYKLRL